MEKAKPPFSLSLFLLPWTLIDPNGSFLSPRSINLIPTVPLST